LSHLSHAYQLAIKRGVVSRNLFDGLTDDIKIKPVQKVISQSEAIHDDESVLDKSKAFSWVEVQAILDYIKNTPNLAHWFPFIQFKFLTGCRTGEAIALWWGDVKWDDECIVFRRSYSTNCRIHKATKNSTARLFPMRKDGELWKLLKSLNEGNPNENVFVSKFGKTISHDVLHSAWRGNSSKRTKGIISPLIEQGKVSKYLPPYNTRHSFINHQINDIGIAPHIVNAWCEHSDDVSKAHYRELDLRVTPGYGEVKVAEKSELELLKEQNKALMELLQQSRNSN
jgi:integrase